MIEEKNDNYVGQGIRGPLWTVAGTAIGGLAIGALSALANGLAGGNRGPNKDMAIAELRSQNYTLQAIAPINQQLAFQGATNAYLQRTLDAVVRPMVPMPNVAGPAFPPPPYPFPATAPSSTGGTEAADNG